ncbi:GatB/YqeY domain-containing protein [Desulfocurvibacter africanus]|uniref:GatB/YqeY family protein n=1 Tax=Desulfocurvibacter africanus subsp. africanus str. Walvis Bay TaxID=690850 RepID=F3Z2Z2_DESAF|nr:GatB/YqeY domain-containing protein [Desulfocurvibacter africanus]EGJ51400.1 GatB/YqeY family protein [Desulfocurvibacter africanus subsp. africanus str. Walvis Bay]
MSIAKQIEQDFVTAYKAKEQLRVAVLRMLKTAIKNRHVELMRELSDDEILDVIIRQVKQRQEAEEQFRAANRAELADKESAEADILRSYLPAQLSREELAALVDKIVIDLGASGLKDMGRVMKAIMDSHKGRVDGKAVSELVKARLS